jgi:flagellar basal-body rod protein FlgF
MDRMLYVAMTGAKETLRAQTVNNHNLANVSTTGFRADLAAFQSRAVDGTGFASRVYATNASVGWDETSGALLTTGRGPINVPPYTSIFFARDGSISIVAQGQTPDTTSTVGRIKLVNPPEADIERGDDGLFRMKDRSDAPPDAAVQISSGVLESSNVNTAAAMVNMIELARQFEMQVKAIRTAEENGQAASQLLRV